MDLTLGNPERVPDFSEALARPQTSLAAALAHFQALTLKSDSPIRAIRHQPARAAERVDIPESVHPQLREGLIRRNILSSIRTRPKPSSWRRPAKTWLSSLPLRAARPSATPSGLRPPDA